MAAYFFAKSQSAYAWGVTYLCDFSVYCDREGGFCGRFLVVIWRNRIELNLNDKSTKSSLKSSQKILEILLLSLLVRMMSLLRS